MEKNILVVEDNEVNLELITLLIDQYSKEHDCLINLFTAANGKEAVELCESESMDIVFMDLMMPTMNGSEATRLIKTSHPKTMVIVISAFGDEAKQKEMLQNGAEDYMIKPIVSSLFKSRLHNYLQIIQHRNHIKHVPKARNLFTTKVYHYHMDFTVSSEADLCEFWEAILMRLEFQRHIDRASDFVRFIYRLGSFQLQQKFQFNILIEEDTENFYFTMNNIKLIGCNKISSLIGRYFEEADYQCKDNLLTFRLPKIPAADMHMPSTSAKDPLPSVTPSDLPVLQSVEEELRTFDILDQDDLEDLEEHILKLRSLIILMQNSGLESEDVDQLCHSFDEMASILSISNDTYVLSNALHELSASISHNQDYFKESAANLFDFVNAFVNDLLFWKTKIFYEGAPSVDFLNDSITTNANMLHALLQPETENDKTEETLDDIFDF